MSETISARYQLKLEDRSTRLPAGNDLWEGDALDRGNTAERLVNMLSGQRGPLTVALNGPWGSGKTYFLARFRELYRRQNGVAVCFNAWSDDFLEDPLLSLLGQLTSELGKNPNDHFGGSLAQAIGPILAKAGFALCKSFARNTLKIDIDDLSLDDLATKGEKLLGAFKEMTASRDELRKALTDVGNKVRAETGKPLLIIVDELDRCRPTFAVELLERIKHLFSLENIVFLLGIDRAELEKSIAAVYGKIDTQRYLYRFIDIEFPLPSAPLRKFIREQLVDAKLGRVLEDDSEQLGNLRIFSTIFSAIADAQRMPLRDVEHALRQFALVVFFKGGLTVEVALLSAYALALKMSKKLDLYRRFLRGECQPKEIVDSLFLHFDVTDFLKMKEQNPITFLYYFYYILANDGEFRHKFEVTCAQLEFAFEEPVTRTLFPSLTQTCSNEDLFRYFGWVKGDSVAGNTWKTILAEIDQAMSSVTNLS